MLVKRYDMLIHRLFICLETLLVLSIVQFSETFYGMISIIGFMPEKVKEFILETKEVVGLLTMVVVLIVSLKKLFKGEK